MLYLCEIVSHPLFKFLVDLTALGVGIADLIK